MYDVYDDKEIIEKQLLIRFLYCLPLTRKQIKLMSVATYSTYSKIFIKELDLFTSVVVASAFWKAIILL